MTNNDQQQPGVTEKPDDLLTVEEVATKLRVTRHTAYQYIKNGLIQAIRLGGQTRGRLRVRREAVDAYLAGAQPAAVPDSPAPVELPAPKKEEGALA